MVVAGVMKRMARVVLAFVLAASLLGVALGGGETVDYYGLLGVDRSASLVEIRRAFKKLAVTAHPDKSSEEGAEEKFQSITRAYEVLKDDEMRKKYDQFGEEGLKEDHPSNRQHQQWGR